MARVFLSLDRMLVSEKNYEKANKPTTKKGKPGCRRYNRSTKVDNSVMISELLRVRVPLSLTKMAAFVQSYKTTLHVIVILDILKWAGGREGGVTAMRRR